MRRRSAALGLALMAFLTAGACDVVNRPPVADVACSACSGASPLRVSLDASASVDPDGTIVEYSWDLGNGSYASGALVTQTYSATAYASYVVTLVVTDDRGASASAGCVVRVSVGGFPPCDCSGKDLNCGDFPSQSRAQACHDYCKEQGLGDVFELDGDGDGAACEALP